MLFRTQYNKKECPSSLEKIEGISLTTPDMALTIPEIIKRYASGRNVNVQVYDQYDGDMEDKITGVDIRTLDIVQVSELLEKAKLNIETLQSEQRRRVQAEKDAEIEASIIKKYEARKAEVKEQRKEPPQLVQMEIPIAKEKAE